LLDAYLFVEDADALYAEYAAQGVEFTRGLGNMPWHCREFVIATAVCWPSARTCNLLPSSSPLVTRHCSSQSMVGHAAEGLPRASWLRSYQGESPHGIVALKVTSITK
jgi:hypothetical protein